jgi:hypothetical protein
MMGDHKMTTTIEYEAIAGDQYPTPGILPDRPTEGRKRPKATHCHRGAALCLAAVVLLACSTLQARSEAFLIDSQSAKIIPTTPVPDIQFSITFNQPPDLFTADAYGRQADDFQVYTPDAVIRGAEIYITRNTIRIRSYGPPDLGDPASGGWGPIIATVPFHLSGDTVTFSAPFNLFSNSPYFTYQIQTDYYGIAQEYVQGSTAPEPATWAMMLLGFAGLGYAGYRESRKRVSFTG